MNLFEQRQLVERVLAVARGSTPERDKRAAINAILNEHRGLGAREMTLIAVAGALAAGGRFTTPASVFAALPPGGGLDITHDATTGAVTVEVKEQFAPLLQFLAGGGDGPFVASSVTVPDPPDYPPANLEESADRARVRICEAVKLLVNRYYRGEFEVRGYAFMSTVFGELLAMALGIERAHQVEPPASMVEWLEEFARELAPQVERYQHATEELQRVAGDPPSHARLM